MTLTVGDVLKFERKFTNEDVALFTNLSGDEGNHHTHPDELGRVVVQGLLTATLPTKIGGDNNVLARTMNFEFLRPVFTGDTIVCEVTIDEFVEKKPNRMSISTSFSCTNQEEKLVLQGTFSGVIRLTTAG
ncbi:FAS1-like dehydratase domain-containing protein [Sporosarcina ureilytica]|uniref:Enoyl-CoA hydratase n=1 Tax=Sporosarcina ureilytica TaxID=298596 RepID=A0A1D8JG20_9BACL|nr:MaoC family dehydratase N-terminal domain-containing protein [Sporosarcina ureilytica]AOV07654.1 enoyl-CoA hydratase [Sporosarcina ureilytica]